MGKYIGTYVNNSCELVNGKYEVGVVHSILIDASTMNSAKHHLELCYPHNDSYEVREATEQEISSMRTEYASEITLPIDGKNKVITLSDEADFDYRSGYVEPNHWIICNGITEDGLHVSCWYYVEDTNIELDEIDYDKPHDIVDEDGECIYYEDDMEECEDEEFEM